MTRRKSYRNLLLALLLGGAVGVVMLSMFYGQYRWLASEIVAESVLEQQRYLRDSFERRARRELSMLAFEFADAAAASDAAAIRQRMNRALRDNRMIIGARVDTADGHSYDAGNAPSSEVLSTPDWRSGRFVVAETISDGARELGTLTVAFDTTEIRAETAAFVDRLMLTERERRRASYVWIGAGTLATLAICGLAIFLVSREQTLRIRELKIEAQKLRDSDFGRPLREDRGDELGELAGLFNTMRDRLKSTALSRDYVDSVLSSMNDAIIVTSADGRIKRINKATTHLLGYDESELLET